MRVSTDPPVDPATYRFSHTVRPRFAETDAMGVVHHAAYLPYLEEARIEYLRAAGRPYDVVRDDGVDIAVLEVFARYRRPLRFDELVDVHVRLGPMSRTTCEIWYLLAVEGEARATAVTVHAFVDRAGRPQRLPPWMRELGENEA